MKNKQTTIELRDYQRKFLEQVYQQQAHVVYEVPLSILPTVTNSEGIQNESPQIVQTPRS